MCQITSEIYTEARAIADHLLALAERIAQVGQDDYWPRKAVEQAMIQLQQRGDTLALAVLERLVEECPPRPSPFEIAASLPVPTLSMRCPR